MYLDYELTLSNAQALTVSTSSTSYVDTVMSGWGADQEVYARFMVTTAFGVTTTSSVTLAIQIAQDTAFGTSVTVVQILKQVQNLTVNSVPLVVKLPADMFKGFGSTLPYRYIRAYYTLAAGANTGSISCHLIKDAQTTLDKVM
jgi:hypothetical protein